LIGHRSLFERLARGFRAPAAGIASILDSPTPIREELLGADRLEEHAEQIARQRTLP